MRHFWMIAALMPVLMPVLPVATAAAAAAAAAQAGGSDVPLRLDGLERQTVAWSDHGKERSCEGVWMRDLLAREGAPAGDAVRGAALSMVVRAEAADGYTVVFSLGEIDAKLGAARLLVADRCDGAALDQADGPLRLVAAGEARGARSVRQLVKLTLVPLDE